MFENMVFQETEDERLLRMIKGIDHLLIDPRHAARLTEESLTRALELRKKLVSNYLDEIEYVLDCDKDTESK